MFPISVQKEKAREGSRLPAARLMSKAFRALDALVVFVVTRKGSAKPRIERLQQWLEDYLCEQLH